jgi:hypothetical protein
MIDPKDPNRATLAPSPTGAGVKVTTISANGGSPIEVDLGNAKPEDGSAPYQASLLISFTNPEKAERAARLGPEVPLRYDPIDRQTVAIDSIAMGYDDPYGAVRSRPGYHLVGKFADVLGPITAASRGAEAGS